MKYNVKRMTWKTAGQEAKPEFPNRVCICFLSLLSLFSSPSPLLVSSWGVHRLGQLDSRRGLRNPCSQIACNFIFVCKYVFLVRCVAGEKKKQKKTGAQTSLTSNYTCSLFGRQTGMSSGLLAGQKIEYSGDREENGQRETLVRHPQALGFYFILMLEHVWSNRRKWFATKSGK